MCDHPRMDTPFPPPLADLHRHLDGSLRPATLADLAANAGVEVPPDLYFTPGMGLDAALACFRTTLSVLQSPVAVRRVASEICEDAEREGVRTLEIRFAPHLHPGAPMREIVEAAVAGANGRAGIILCALYGDDPDLVMSLVECGGRVAGVVGVDLAGGPIPSHSWAMEDYASAFARAGELGLGRTVHAGEGRAPSEIRTAIERLGAERIGHGTTLLDDPHLLDLVVERGITIEACPTSNVQTGVIAGVEDHPLPQWLERGVRACVCTDNTLFSRVDSASEHRLAAGIPGMTPALLRRAIDHGHSSRFGAHSETDATSSFARCPRSSS